ncbi:uncharacterized protein LOC107820947 [Nicotiana tabacum]|uniref:Uncharacterized protein LOC107820947 n=1 Tax=Nicotiana tabacum TaxID=4097 RepID=A0AC58S356_TOBAC
MDIVSTCPIYKCRCLTKLTQVGLNASLALCFFQKLEKIYQEKITKKQKMGCWSAENATKAFLKTMNMGKRAIEPNEAEFISALAVGNNVQLMVVACANVADSTTRALAAAAQQTGGRVVGEGLLLTRIGAKAKKGYDSGDEK